ncbi:diacylglycerol kinase family protein [Lactococcus garvieae]|jgi:undecaprenol kinase|uniref:Diacylglycerol kinase n=1 Tax=Lactococcus garvieae DCC43 TaxID=1231377 RepID=K2PTQ4_9LACT|nr:diacylglycerol kinase family protein [Lactococcus garvieae]EKF50871.1 Diacylglycerol kinase [Lactococcus garvieae DCC43]
MGSKDNEKDVKIFNKEDFADGEVPESSERKRWKNTNVISSMEFAITGIWTAFKEERNMRKHAFSAVLALIFGIVFHIHEFEWLFLFLAIFLVFTAELLNSAIENVVDLAADYQFHLRAKRAKDMAAGAVLVISGFALLVAVFIFLPKIWSLLF